MTETERNEILLNSWNAVLAEAGLKPIVKLIRVIEYPPVAPTEDDAAKS